MKLVWGSLSLFFFLALPGYLFAIAFGHASRRGMPNLKAPHLLVGTLLGSVTIHSLLIWRLPALLELDSEARKDLVARLVGLTDSETGVQSLLDVLLASPSGLTVVTYGLFVVLFAVSLGSTMGFLNYLQREPDVWENLLYRSPHVYMFVDLLDTEGMVYQGLFHSRIHPHKEQGPAIALSLVSRKQLLKGMVFKDVRAAITGDEVFSLLLRRERAVAAPDLSDDDITQALAARIRDSHDLSRCLGTVLDAPPQIVIPFHSVANLNVRHFTPFDPEPEAPEAANHAIIST